MSNATSFVKKEEVNKQKCKKRGGGGIVFS